VDAPSSSSVPAPTDDELYAHAGEHPLSALLLAALHEQDALSYHGQGSSGIGRRALDLAAAVSDLADDDEVEIRRHERECVARLLEEHVEVLAGWPKDVRAAIEMVAFLLRLPGGKP
jgi:hypothetical protein